MTREEFGKGFAKTVHLREESWRSDRPDFVNMLEAAISYCTKRQARMFQDSQQFGSIIGVVCGNLRAYPQEIFSELNLSKLLYTLAEKGNVWVNDELLSTVVTLILLHKKGSKQYILTSEQLSRIHKLRDELLSRRKDFADQSRVDQEYIDKSTFS